MTSRVLRPEVRIKRPLSNNLEVVIHKFVWCVRVEIRCHLSNIKWTVTVRHGREGEEDMHRADSFLRSQGPPPTGRFPEPHDFGRHVFKYILIVSSRLHTGLITSCPKIKTLHAQPCHYLSYNYASNILNTANHERICVSAATTLYILTSSLYEDGWRTTRRVRLTPGTY